MFNWFQPSPIPLTAFFNAVDEFSSKLPDIGDDVTTYETGKILGGLSRNFRELHNEFQWKRIFAIAIVTDVNDVNNSHVKFLLESSNGTRINFISEYWFKKNGKVIPKKGESIDITGRLKIKSFDLLTNRDNLDLMVFESRLRIHEQTYRRKFELSSIELDILEYRDSKAGAPWDRKL